jgi:hypothetical protein
MIMPLPRRLLRLCSLPVALLVWFLGSIAWGRESWYESALPVLFAKSWAIGYALVFLGILLGLLAVTIPSMRKALRKKDMY